MRAKSFLTILVMPFRKLLKLTTQFLTSFLGLIEFHHFAIIANHLPHDGNRICSEMDSSIFINFFDPIESLPFLINPNSFFECQISGKNYLSSFSANSNWVSPGNPEGAGACMKLPVSSAMAKIIPAAEEAVRICPSLPPGRRNRVGISLNTSFTSNSFVTSLPSIITFK